MDNLTNVLVLLYRRIPARSVIDGRFNCVEIKRTELISAASAYMKEYSENELSNLWQYLTDMFRDERILYNRTRHAYDRGINAFDALFATVPRMLVEQNNSILCRYDRLMPWRMITFALSEDLLICSFLAQRKTPMEMDQLGFSWKIVIDHNNIPLQEVVRRGISENHFHLYGSSPMFHLSWISMMNDVMMSGAAESLLQYDKDRRHSNVHISTEYKEDSLTAQYYQASLIRLYLYSLLAEERIWLCYDSSTGKRALLNYEMVMELLQNTALLRMRLPRMQSAIISLRIGQEELPDYILRSVNRRYEHYNDIFGGERWLLYQCLYRIYHGQFDERHENLFYIYLLLRETIRGELIQSNQNVGFINFQKYERRKRELINDSIFSRDIVRTAVRKNLMSRYVRSLEIRVSPKNTAREDLELIRRLDSIIGMPKNKYYYTLHFIKEEDKMGSDGVLMHCRHERKRMQIMKQANALIELREKYPRCACRILGIDAASNEIGCRPEVFAPEFRHLRKHVKVLEDSSHGRRIPQIRVTYHVGEDFLDLADGLRAIDEAVNFLNMDCGDRMGHALALGVDVEDWYRSKNNRILISQQDYLDNLVWMYNRLIEFHIPDVEVLKDYLLKRYEYYFDQIYARNMDYGLIDAILEGARKKYKKISVTNAFHNDRYRFEIFQYYNAWKLRGDDPELYSHGYFWWDDDEVPEISYRVNLKFPHDFMIRYRPEIFLLNYYYQYDDRVRREGNKRIEVKINSDYIRGVALIQKEMQKLIGRKGIAIETNPSSNFLIGTFRDYAKHPIFTFYNKEFITDQKLRTECPQLSVSVNTDDQGVFSTSLENEYALLACALENKTDENGQPIYKKSDVYDWVDAVRRMGNEQSFMTDREEYGELLDEEY